MDIYKSMKMKPLGAKLGDDTPQNTGQAHGELTARWLQQVIYSALFCSVMLQVASVVSKQFSMEKACFTNLIFLLTLKTLIERKPKKFKQNAHLHYYSHFSMT